MSSIYSAIIGNCIVAPIMKIAGRDLFGSMKRLKKSEWWPFEKIEELQNKRLHNLVSYSYDNVPYYRDLMRNERLKPADIREKKDLYKLPILTKDIIRANYNRMKSDIFNKIPTVRIATGGSMGDPLQLWLDRSAWTEITASRFRGWSMAGYHYGDRMLTIAGSSLLPADNSSIHSRLFQRLTRNVLLSGISMNDRIFKQYTDVLLNSKARYVFGYASSIYLWGEYLNRNKVGIDNLKAVLTTAELLYPSYRKAIESGFGCKVFDGYGARDAGITAFECSNHNGWHISSELCITETIDSESGLPSTESGNIVVTNLINNCMPMIRYSLGDIGSYTVEPCSCNRGLPRLVNLVGRSSEVFRLANGKILTGPAFTVLFSKLSFSKYQIIQTSSDSILVKAVKSKSSFRESDIEKARNIIQIHAGSDVNITIQLVNDIPKLSSGKRPYYVSL